jgi:hypothetical protein
MGPVTECFVCLTVAWPAKFRIEQLLPSEEGRRRDETIFYQRTGCCK